ncbi:MAG TPA: hypothetical protein PK971_06160, partial [Saprospiraceae bacterium]|nr:hypothetical protein [Saprospiraceae bacterium]
MKHTLLLWLCWASLGLGAQNAPCSEYADMLKRLEATYQNGRGNLEECLDLVESLRACDPTKSELAGQWTKRIFEAIKRQKQEALEATQKAAANEVLAKNERDRALRLQKQADSTATAAQRAARRAYANDLAYKSRIALQG